MNKSCKLTDCAAPVLQPRCVVRCNRQFLQWNPPDCVCVFSLLPHSPMTPYLVSLSLSHFLSLFHTLPLSPSHRPFSLLVMKLESLTSLGLRSLREINGGSVYISNNTNLCYHHTVEWMKIFTGAKRRDRLKYNDIKFNKPKSQCGKPCFGWQVEV